MVAPPVNLVLTAYTVKYMHRIYRYTDMCTYTVYSLPISLIIRLTTIGIQVYKYVYLRMQLCKIGQQGRILKSYNFTLPHLPPATGRVLSEGPRENGGGAYDGEMGGNGPTLGI